MELAVPRVPHLAEQNLDCCPRELTNLHWADSPSEADNHSPNQEILRFLLSLKVHYRLHKSPPLSPNLSQMNPVHTFPPCFRNIHLNVISPSTPLSYEWSLPFRFSDQNFVCISHLSRACCLPCPSHPP
jgi:hypothetical protein